MSETVLLTGATGFLGCHLLEGLIDEGYNVVILKRSTSDTQRIDHLLEKVVAYDVDEQSVELAFEENDIDVVIHTACHYGRNQDSISVIVESNLMFALRVLDASIKHRVGSFFNTGSLLPASLNAYSLSKHQFSEWLKHSSEKIKCINIRLEHMYGTKDDETKFIPWLLGQMISSDEVIKLTEGTQKRDFIYIDDVVSAYMLLLKKADTLAAWDEFDVGSGLLVPVKDFVNELRAVVEKTMNVNLSERLAFGAVPYRDGEVMEPTMDVSKLTQLGWKPTVSLNEGLNKLLKELR